MGAYFISQFIKQSLQLSLKNNKNKDNITSFLQLFREYHKEKNEFYYQTPSCLIDMLKQHYQDIKLSRFHSIRKESMHQRKKGNLQ